MMDERPDQFTMIGLHKLASETGDALVPELYEILADRIRLFEDNRNVIELPVWQSPRRRRACFGVAFPLKDNIVPFPSGAAVAVPKKDRA